eukprot:TRINITY_DN19338_c0_g1_i2.p1 TRINITY_DN19338_c0_g1~~TRINITY_DN19338_c0_g1_i2.p1  ORF type:complete len:395 (+),score=49.59 TRINITY_DN19338_c0_g1_i2:173-1357(+)
MSGSLVWLGALLAVFASMSGTAGKQLMRFSELQRLKGTSASLCMSQIALAAGLLLNVLIGPLIDMGSYAFAPQSIIAPLGGLDVVWNTLSAPFTLGETLTPPLMAGCFFIAAGATGTSLGGSHEEKDYTPDLLKKAFLRWPVLLYLLALAAWIAFNVLVLIPRSKAPKGEPFQTGDPIRGLSLGMTAGSIAGNMFCVKAFVEVVQSAIDHDRPDYFADWFPYALLIGAVFFATSNLYFLTKAMREYEALFIGSVFEGTLITAACLSGCVVYADLEGLPAWKIVIYWCSVGSIIGGIVIVAREGLQKVETEDADGEKTKELETGVELRTLQVNTEVLVDGQPVLRQASSQSMNSRQSLNGSATPASPFRGLPTVIDPEVTKVSSFKTFPLRHDTE